MKTVFVIFECNDLISLVALEYLARLQNSYETTVNRNKNVHSVYCFVLGMGTHIQTRILDKTFPAYTMDHRNDPFDTKHNKTHTQSNC